MFSWRKKDLDELLLTPEQVICKLDEIRVRSKGSVNRFVKLLKKNLGETFQLLNVHHDSALHRFAYREFLKGHFTAQDTFALIVALNQDKGCLTREAFERLLPLLTTAEWNNVLSSLIVPSEGAVPLMAGFVLAYPEFSKTSGIEETNLRAYLFQSLSYWSYFTKKDLKAHLHHFINWIGLGNNNRVVLDLLSSLLNLNDLDLVDMIVELVNAWLMSEKCQHYLQKRLLDLIQKNYFLGDFVLIGTFAKFVAAGVIERDMVVHWIKSWKEDERIDVRRMIVRYLPNWLQEGIIDRASTTTVLDEAFMDANPYMRREVVSTVFQLFHRQLLSFDDILSRIRDFSRDSSSLVKEALFRNVVDLNIEPDALNVVLAVIKPTWVETLQSTLEEDQLLTTSLRLLERFYRLSLLTAGEIRLLIQPYFESSQWKIRHATVQQLPFLLSEEIFTKDVIRRHFRKEKNRTVRDAVERFLIAVK